MSESKSPYRHPGANLTADAMVLRPLSSGEGYQVLLIRRADHAATEGGKWALPGGFQNTSAKRGEPFAAGAESAGEACLRELLEETGLDLRERIDALIHIGDFEGGGRDPRDSAEAWSRAQAFVIELPQSLRDRAVSGLDDAAEAGWFDVAALPTLAFDHAEIIAIGLRRFGGQSS